MTDETKPKLGDRVRVRSVVGRWGACEGEVVDVRDNGYIKVDVDYEIVGFQMNEVEVIDPVPVVRVEGYPMAFNHVKVGDTVETVSSYRDQGVNVKVSREGVVGQIDSREKVLRTRGGSLLGDMKMRDAEVVIHLVKSMENDQTFMSLSELPVESVVSYRRKEGGLLVAAQIEKGSWQVTNANKTFKTLTLREMLRSATDGSDEFQIIHRGDS